MIATAPAATAEARAIAPRVRQVIADVARFAKQGWCKRDERSKTRHYLILGAAHEIAGAAEALQTLVRRSPEWLERWDDMKAAKLAARRRPTMTTDDTITRLAEQATARERAVKSADEAPLQRIRDDLAPAIADALAAVERAKPIAAEHLPVLRSARAVLSKEAYRRVRGVDLALNGYPKQKVVDEALAAVKSLMSTLEEHPAAIERIRARIQAVSTSDLVRPDFAPGKRRELVRLAYTLTPAVLEAAFADVVARLARIAGYGVADDGVTAAPVPGPPIADTKPRQAFAVSSTARPNGAA